MQTKFINQGTTEANTEITDVQRQAHQPFAGGGTEQVCLHPLNYIRADPWPLDVWATGRTAGQRGRVSGHTRASA